MSSILDIIILAVVAGFFIFRLFSVLGAKAEDESSAPEDRENFVDDIKAYQEHKQAERNLRKQQKEEGQDSSGAPPDMDAPHRAPSTPGHAPAQGTDEAAEAAEVPHTDIESPAMPFAPDTKLGAAFLRLRAADQDFTPASFLDGVQSAHTLIIEAYANDTLSDVDFLLSEEVYQQLASASIERQAKSQELVISLVGYGDTEVIDADEKGALVTLTVRIEYDQFFSLTDDKGVVIEGDTSTLESVVDIWQFQKAISDDDPTWTLVATKHG
ncbi:MAG: Tim44/TimA family putative adaptor protein [Alphaproteobacteria bacterium]|nr:Tim44/TimA family putative adaptor protein [Alphaproteobacteria bacterium]